MKVEISNENKLRQIVKEAVMDALEEEMVKLKLLLAPYISDEEQQEIGKNYGEPSKEVSRTLILGE